MKQFQRASVLVLAAAGGLSYTWLSGAEYVSQGRPIPVVVIAPLGLLTWIAGCWLLATKRKKLIAWWILLSAATCTTVASGFLSIGFPEDRVTPFIGALLFAHLLVMLWSIRRVESRLR